MERCHASPESPHPQDAASQEQQCEGGGKEHQLGRDQRPPLPRSVGTLKRRLCTLYENRTVDLERGLSYQKQSLDLDEIYANLHVVARDELKARVATADELGSGAGVEKMAHSFRAAAKKLKKVKLGKIFHIQPSMRKKMSRKSVLVLTLSCAGGGKTMLFTKKAPHDWAKGRIWKSIDLVFALELRSTKVRQAESLTELLGIKKYGIDTVAECCEVRDFIYENPAHVCIVLDGLDETKLEDCSDFVKGLIKGELLPGIRLILTSRHSSEVMKLVMETEFHLRLEVLGFQKGEVDHYVHNVLEPQDAAEVVSELKSNPQLEAMMQTPFFAAATCSLFRCGVKLPDTLGKIFSSLILDVLHQQQKETSDTKLYSNWESVPDPVKESILELGFFAFQMLIRRKVVFSEADLDTFEVPEAARSLGLLVACDKESHSIGAEEQWRFSHLAIQESLAARHVASCGLSADDTTWLVNHLGAFTGHLNTFWLLLAAELDSKSADALLNAILNPRAQSSSHQDGGQCMKGAEGHDVTHFLCASRRDVSKWAEHISEILSRGEVERLAIQLLNDHVGLRFPRLAVEAHLRPAEVERTVDFMQGLLLRWRRFVPRANTQLLYGAIDSFAPGLAVKCFTNVPSPESAQVQYEQSSSEPLLPLSAANPEERRRRLLFACRCFAEHVNSEHSTAPLQNLEPVVEKHGLDFNSVPLTATDCHAINSVLLRHHQSIAKIDFMSCYAGDSGYERLTRGLDLCHNLDELQLAANSISDRHASHIGTVIRSNSSTLLQLYTSLNTFTNVGNTQMHQYTHLCTKLQELSIGGQGSTDVPVNLTYITRILESCSDLDIVIFDGCMIGDDGLAQLQTLLSSLKVLALGLDKAGLTQECAPVMNLILQNHQDSLRGFAVTSNDLTDSFIPTVYHALSLCQSLEEINLVDVHLTSASLPVLSSLLPSWPHIRRLCLANNDFRGAQEEDVHLFVQAVNTCTSLTLLQMPGIELQDPKLQDMTITRRWRDDLVVKNVNVIMVGAGGDAEEGGEGVDEVASVDVEDNESEEDSE